MYETIVVPTDGSDVASGAAEHAFALAQAFDATVHVLYVVDESAGRLLLDTHSVGSVLEALSAEGEAATTDLADRAEGIEVITDVIRGMHTAEAIADYATEHDADLIVMGTQGRHGMKHLLGSVTERVLARASVPVLALSTASLEAAGIDTAGFETTDVETTDVEATDSEATADGTTPDETETQ